MCCNNREWRNVRICTIKHSLVLRDFAKALRKLRTHAAEYLPTPAPPLELQRVKPVVPDLSKGQSDSRAVFPKRIDSSVAPSRQARQLPCSRNWARKASTSTGSKRRHPSILYERRRPSFTHLRTVRSETWRWLASVAVVNQDGPGERAADLLDPPTSSLNSRWPFSA